jgi:hypothetical protein
MAAAGLRNFAKWMSATSVSSYSSPATILRSRPGPRDKPSVNLNGRSAGLDLSPGRFGVENSTGAEHRFVERAAMLRTSAVYF